MAPTTQGPARASHLMAGLWSWPPRRGGAQFIVFVAFVPKAASCPYLTSVSRPEIRLRFPSATGLLNTSWERTCVLGYLLYNPGLSLNCWDPKTPQKKKGYKPTAQSFWGLCLPSPAAPPLAGTLMKLCSVLLSFHCPVVLYCTRQRNREVGFLFCLSLSHTFIMFQNPYSSCRSLDNYSCFICNRHIFSFISFPKPWKKHLLDVKGRPSGTSRRLVNTFMYSS